MYWFVCEKNNNVLVSLAKTIRKDREIKQGLLTSDRRDNVLLNQNS